MVTTEIGQLSSECNAWLSELRSLRQELTSLKAQLVPMARNQHNKDILLEVEHLDNQFHIQLINIHDVKHSIKVHERKVELEKAMQQGHVTENSLQEHENLFDDFEALKNTITELKEEFREFAIQAVY
ncbi:MAG TPA: hypothetical protein VLC28_00215 [Flavitalea sp.]|nr:hypothetical protein [Flavitalea sp.]